MMWPYRLSGPHQVPLPSVESLKRFLDADGWAPIARGPRGEMWERATARVAVPHDWSSDSELARGIVERVADAAGTDPDKLWWRLVHDNYDLIGVSLAGRTQRESYPELRAATVAMDGARRLISCAGTSAVRPRRHINRAYDPRAQRVAREALLGPMGQEPGAFPVYVRVGSTGTSDSLFDDAQFETFPRRTIRALADSLAVTRRLVDEGGSWDQSVINDAVAAGVSSELCSSLEKMLRSQAVDEVEITVEWGMAGAAAPSSPMTVSFDTASLPALSALAEDLARPVPDPEAEYVGRLITIGHDHEDREFYLVMHTYHAGRPIKLRIVVGKELHDRAVRWYEDRVTIVAHGRIDDASTHPIIRVPLSVRALVESRLV